MTDKLMAELQAAGITPDLITYNTVMSAHSRSKKLSAALALAKEAVDDKVSAQSIYTHTTHTHCDFWMCSPFRVV